MKYVILLLVLCSCSTTIEAHYCDTNHCNDLFADFIGKDTDCAFYSLNSPSVINALDNSNARVIMEKAIDRKYVKANKSSGLMHNKFCVNEDMVITGSFNPGERTNRMDNVVIIKDRLVAQLYKKEFEELWGDKTDLKNFFQLNKHKVYFCPEDDCAKKIINEINKAKRKINFMYYSFTSGEIALALIQAKARGVSVKGSLEGSQLSEYSQYDLLNYQEIPVTIENTSMLLHHKFIVIDNATVITGSFNPTKNGQLRNDENIIIIRNEKIAQYFNPFQGFV